MALPSTEREAIRALIADGREDGGERAVKRPGTLPDLGKALLYLANGYEIQELRLAGVSVIQHPGLPERRRVAVLTDLPLIQKPTGTAEGCEAAVLYRRLRVDEKERFAAGHGPGIATNTGYELLEPEVPLTGSLPDIVFVRTGKVAPYVRIS
ncbi:hypothetical protein HYW35_02455 [Candidatus Saccharibacteria bacterium]|nr:hypothetical protein [Candidatus Saccharibacteria bacterium]